MCGIDLSFPSYKTGACVKTDDPLSLPSYLSHRLLNLYGEIGSGYSSMSMMEIGLLLPILRQRWHCLLYDVY
jgi:hypothetical protein